MSKEIDVLVVDDVAEAAQALASLLESDGYRVNIALSGQEAKLALGRYQPLCVLMDFQMPDMDGLDLARYIKLKFGDDIVLIVCTGMPPSHQRVAEVFAVADHYFAKPVPEAELRKIFPPKPTHLAG